MTNKDYFTHTAALRLTHNVKTQIRSRVEYLIPSDAILDLHVNLTINLISLASQSINQSINQSNYFIVRPKVDQRAGQLSLPHLGITKTYKIELKHKTDQQISPVNSLEP